MEHHDGEEEIVRLRQRGWSARTIACWLRETEHYVATLLYKRRVATPPKDVRRLGNREGRQLILQRSLAVLTSASNPSDDAESLAIRDRIRSRRLPG
jgi:hypothetical protein